MWIVSHLGFQNNRMPCRNQLPPKPLFVHFVAIVPRIHPNHWILVLPHITPTYGYHTRWWHQTTAFMHKWLDFVQKCVLDLPTATASSLHRLWPCSHLSTNKQSFAVLPIPATALLLCCWVLFSSNITPQAIRLFITQCFCSWMAKQCRHLLSTFPVDYMNWWNILKCTPNNPLCDPISSHLSLVLLTVCRWCFPPLTTPDSLVLRLHKQPIDPTTP